MKFAKKREARLSRLLTVFCPALEKRFKFRELLPTKRYTNPSRWGVRK